jgi:urease accessory protein
MATMSAAASPSDRAPAGRQRAEARAVLAASRPGGRTELLRLAESGAYRVRLPRRTGAELEAVLINTAGGIACGDRFAVEIALEPEAVVVVATPSAEKVYRSDDGSIAEMTVALRLGAGARLDWLPQETILFDRARLRRRFEVDMAADASLLMVEATIFGRAAHGEAVHQGLLDDRWTVRRGGDLVHADRLRLEGAVHTQLQHPAIGHGARAMATMLYIAPDAESRLDAVRDLLAECRGEAGASAWSGRLVVRLVHADVQALRADATRLLTAFRGTPMPRVWTA